MYRWLNELLADRTGGEVFTCFGGWHLLYVLVAAGLAAVLLLLWRKRARSDRERAAGYLIDAAFSLYLLDFFLMPLAYGEIDIEKLPFHICTQTCVLCFLSRHVQRLSKYRVHFALIGFISNLVYLIYPAGVMWHQVHPLSYRVVQTLLFHAVMTVYGLLVLIYEGNKLFLRTCYRDLLILSGITAFAIFGNLCYNGEHLDYRHFFNWFFVVRDPFYLLPEAISPYVMPFVNITLFFSAEILVYLILLVVKRKQHGQKG